MSRRIGGHGRYMARAVEFAEQHGFTVNFTRKNHLVFEGYNCKVYGSGTPRCERSALKAIAKMNAVMRKHRESSLLIA